jgi:hypothetical protein
MEWVDQAAGIFGSVAAAIFFGVMLYLIFVLPKKDHNKRNDYNKY